MFIKITFALAVRRVSVIEIYGAILGHEKLLSIVENILMEPMKCRPEYLKLLVASMTFSTDPKARFWPTATLTSLGEQISCQLNFSFTVRLRYSHFNTEKGRRFSERFCEKL